MPSTSPGMSVGLVATSLPVPSRIEIRLTVLLLGPDSVTTANPGGVVVAKKEGQTNLTATFEGLTSGTVNVKVHQIAKSITFGVGSVVFPALQRDTTVSITISRRTFSSIATGACGSRMRTTRRRRTVRRSIYFSITLRYCGSSARIARGNFCE